MPPVPSFRCSLISTAAILCATPLIAQTRTATFSGVITDTAGIGITRAIVRLESNQTIFETTASNHGRFILHAAPGDYTLKVSAEGFQARQQSISLQPDDSKAQVASPALQLSLPVLNLRTDRLAVCEPPASLSGLVTDISGAVVAHAIVRLECSPNKTTLEATTGDDGRYFLYTHPGNYTVTVHFPGFVVPKQALNWTPTP